MTEATMTCECCGGKWRIYVISGPTETRLGWSAMRWFCPACSSAEKVKLRGRQSTQDAAIEWLRQEHAHERACEEANARPARECLEANGPLSDGYRAYSGYVAKHKARADLYGILLGLIPGGLPE